MTYKYRTPKYQYAGSTTRRGGYRCLCGRTFTSSKYLRQHEVGCLQQRIEADLRKRGDAE